MDAGELMCANGDGYLIPPQGYRGLGEGKPWCAGCARAAEHTLAVLFRQRRWCLYVICLLSIVLVTETALLLWR